MGVNALQAGAPACKADKVADGLPSEWLAAFG
jgi:hypothetical protein